MSTPDTCPYCGAAAVVFKATFKLDKSWYRMYQCGTKYMAGFDEDGEKPIVDIEESRTCLRNRLSAMQREIAKRDGWIAIAIAALAGSCLDEAHMDKVMELVTRQSGHAAREIDKKFLSGEKYD